VKKSYLRKYNTLVIHNGVDTTVFKPTNSNIREKYHCENKKIVLGVAAIWDKRKGLDTFLKLSKRLDQSYQIILVGLTQEQIQKVPKNIIGIERTDSVQELVELYSAADVFVNPTLEDNCVWNTCYYV
jgi:putative colanic acid biosynthesis glycosyltransferase